ncbi:MAG TPA: DUF4188 domain-containing protein [Nocardioidaceae bacterium]|nr:DUF4188 domain-containing protein [Nocardioidaceae bacterium]
MTERIRVPAAYRTASAKAPRGVEGGQFTAELSGEESVLFLVGMRINRLRRIRSWWPAFVGMPRMLKELESHPEAGLLGHRNFVSGRVLMSVQHWRSAEDLGRYARNPELAHHPAWGAFNKAVAGSGDVGVFHETYQVGTDSFETLYGNMPLFGLAAAHQLSARGSRRSRTRTRDRLGQQDPEYVEAS